MPSRAAELLGDLEGEASPRPAWSRSSYDFLEVLPKSSRITCGGDSCVSDDMESLLGCSMDG